MITVEKTAYETRRENNENIQGLETWIWKVELIQNRICEIDPLWYEDEKMKIHYHITVAVLSKWKSVKSGDMTSIQGVTQYWDVINKITRIYL